MSCKRGYYDVFVRTCAKYPSKIAIRHYDNDVYKTYTYSELYGVCEYISQILQQLQCNKGIIGLVSRRNILIPCTIAAAHKCCTTFMFLDPTQEVDNISDDMKFTVIITIMDPEQSESLGLLSRKPDQSVRVFDLVISFYKYGPPSTNSSCKYILVHSFIALTSGSTGEPKQVQVPVQCLQPNIEDLTKLFKITPEDIIYFSTPLTFDPSMVEILLAGINGASLLIGPNRVEVLFPENRHNSVTVWQTTPSKFFQYSNAHIKNKILNENSTLRVLALGGEPLNGLKRLKELKHSKNTTSIFTLYGVTEMSCWACAAELDLTKPINDREIPLGTCLSETQVVVEPIPEQKTTGKIILVSKTRKCIILNKSKAAEEINSLKFIDTGDLAEVKNGTIYYRGRKDDIIKRFGHKINLQFIESTIMLCPRVKTCSCLWLPKPMLLVVYFSSETLSSKELSDFLKCKLDDKHWPDKIVRVDNLPTNSHGKICRQLLSTMYETLPSPQLEMKVNFLQELKLILSDNFTYDDVKNKDFFAVGGTSFSAITMCNKISQLHPNFGKFLLPHLMSKRKIGDILEIAEKEVCSLDLTKSKRKLKRTVSSNSTDQASQASKKIVPNNQIEFVTMWTVNTGKCVDASPTLFLSVCNLYVSVGSHSGKVIVVDVITGNVQGSVTLGSRVEASVYCCHQKPVLLPCGVVGSYDGTVVCFMLDDGKEKWRVNVGSMIKSKATCCNGFVYVASYDGNVRCMDIMTGAIKEIIHIADQAISADLVLAKNEYILTGTLSGVCASVHTATNTVAWRGTLGSPVFASPALYDEDKYVIFAEVSGEIHCRTVEKGIKIWKYQGAKGNIFSSIYIKEVGRLKWQMFFGCHDSRVYCINVKNFQPSLYWKTQLSSPVYSTPCALNNKMLIATSNNGKLCVLDSDNGALLAEHSLPNETFSSPAVHSDYLFIGCRNDHLYAFQIITK